ncbi:BLUF domain-containing protein [Brevundimonas sp. KM4]|uniref:BLUF domain-containing protein n=1 Tax=Brevundimonas sp. KM4 TaxID=1628191 RepID=UPI0005F7E163|nr:BLUF domain-containing protein [Brevundimonas sp. KM4]KJV38814.1 hypothetical protein VH88_13955 [Brevundimonas sp. KM4]
MIDRLVYRSQVENVPPEVTLERIFRISVPKNARLQITGALGFSGRNYIQLLEGPRPALDDLLQSLRAEPRHSNLRVLLRGSSQRQLLPNWSMARVDLARAAPRLDALLEAGGGLGLVTLMATLAHEGVTA